MQGMCARKHSRDTARGVGAYYWFTFIARVLVGEFDYSASQRILPT